MRKLLIRNLAGSLLTIAILGVVFGFYYLRVRSQILYFDQGNVRRLATMARQIEGSFDGYGRTLQSLYRNPDSMPLDLERFLWNQTNLELRGQVQNTKKPGLVLEAEQGWLYFNYVPPLNPKQVKPDFPIEDDPERRPKVNFNRKDSIRARASIRYDLDRFVPHDPVIEPFDMIALADNRGQVMYTSSASGVEVSDLSKLFNTHESSEKANIGHVDLSFPNGSKSSLDSSTSEVKSEPQHLDASAPADKSGIRLPDYDRLLAATSAQEMEIAGIHFKTYSQPVVLRMPEAEPLHWVLCGFVRPERFTAQTWSLPYSTLIGLLFVMAIVFLSLPILKLGLVAKLGRFTRSDAMLCLGAALLLPALIGVLSAYINQHIRFDGITRSQVKTVSDEIDDQLYREIKASLLQLAQLTGRLAEQKDRYANAPRILMEGSQRVKLDADPYKNFSLVFWTDKDGMQQVKWSAGDDVTSFEDLTENGAFRRFHDERRQLIDVNGKEREFSFDAERSPATGESRAVIGIPLNGEIKGLTGTPLTAAFLVAKPESLFAPVLPPGLGFCIVEHDGIVRFHNEPLLNRAENLFVESDDNKDLESAVLGDTPRFVRTSYKGRPRTMYVKRLTRIKSFPPLTLVVFKDDIYDQTMTAEIVTIAMGLYGFYILAGLCILATLWIVFRRSWRDWIWPSAQHQRKYARLLLPLALIGFVFSCLLAFVSIRLILFSALILVGLTVVSAWGVFQRQSRRLLPVRLPWVHLPLRDAFTLTCFVLILNVSVLPALAAFRVAYVYETMLFLHYGQQKILEQMETRYDYLHYRELWSHIAPSIWEERYKTDDDALYAYHRAYFNSRLVSGAGGASPSQWFAPWLDPLLEGMNPRYNRIAMEARGMMKDSPDGDWDWPDIPAANDVVLLKHNYQNQPDKTIGIRSNVPIYFEAQSWLPWGIGELLFFVAAAGAVLYLALRWMLGRLFLLDSSVPARKPAAAAPAGVSSRTLLLTEAWDDVDYLARFEGMRVLDFDRLTDTAADYGLYGIRNLDRNTRDPEANRAKLCELEKLLAVPVITIVILSRIDPVFHFHASGMPAEELERWRAALDGFHRIDVATIESSGLPGWSVRGRIDDKIDQSKAAEITKVFENEWKGAPELRAIWDAIAASETKLTSVQQLMDEIADLGEPCYSRIWTACSDWEKIVLRDLASGGLLISPLRGVLRELMRKRLIAPARGYALVSEGFRRYVLSMRDPRAIPSLAAQEARSWDAVPRAIWGLLAGIALIVFLAFILGQRETLQSFVGYLTAALTGVGTIARFLAGTRRAGESKGVDA